MLAVGSHDNFIDIYQCKLAAPSLTTAVAGGLRYLKRLRGHTSYITHLDWSRDNHVIQSTCGEEKGREEEELFSSCGDASLIYPLPSALLCALHTPHMTEWRVTTPHVMSCRFLLLLVTACHTTSHPHGICLSVYLSIQAPTSCCSGTCYQASNCFPHTTR